MLLHRELQNVRVLLTFVAFASAVLQPYKPSALDLRLVLHAPQIQDLALVLQFFLPLFIIIDTFLMHCLECYYRIRTAELYSVH